jgi:hypothetical protein
MRLTFYTVAAVLLLIPPLVRLISTVMPMISRPDDSRCGAAGALNGCATSPVGLLSKMLPQMSELGDKEVALIHVAQL